MKTLTIIGIIVVFGLLFVAACAQPKTEPTYPVQTTPPPQESVVQEDLPEQPTDVFQGANETLPDIDSLDVPVDESDLS